MTKNGSPRIALLGLGNLMRTDDAVGMLTLSRLVEAGRVPHTVRVIEGGTLGLDLLDSLRDVSCLLVLDAVDTGVAPGSLMRFSGNKLDDLPTSKSVHLLGFSDLMAALHLLDEVPREVILFGVQPSSTDWGTVLTPPVEAAQEELMECALAQLAEWELTTERSQLDWIGDHSEDAVQCVPYAGDQAQ